jgi:cell division GTPase FtsZ
MKLLVFGIGGCGSRLAGEFSELNRKARLERRVQIVANSYAINNDQSGLTQLKARCRELQTVFVNRILEDQSAKAGAEVMRVEGSRVLTAIKPGDSYWPLAPRGISAPAESLSWRNN